MTYREPSPRDDYTIRERTRVRFAFHKYPELEGLTCFTLYRKNATQWVVSYGWRHHYTHEERDLVPA